MIKIINEAGRGAESLADRIEAVLLKRGAIPLDMELVCVISKKRPSAPALKAKTAPAVVWARDLAEVRRG